MSIFDKVKDAIVGFWHDDFEPWFKTLLTSTVHAEVAALLPLASNAAGALAADLATNAGDMDKFAETASQILKNTATQAQAAAIQASGASLLFAVNTAISSHAAAVPLGGTPVPKLPPAVDDQAKDDPKAGLHEDGTPWTDDEWVGAATASASTGFLIANGRYPDGTAMSAKDRKKAGLPALQD